MQIVKVSLRRRLELLADDRFVYCGRQFGGFPGSVLGNYIARGSGHAAAIAAYRRWLWDKQLTEAQATWERIQRLPANAILGCWCLDKSVAGSGALECHCDVIARAWKYLQSL